MKTYIYIDENKYWEWMICKYKDLKSITKDFTDYSKLKEIDSNLVNSLFSDSTTRIIINDTEYEIHKIFTLIDKNEQFIILSY